MPNGKCRIHGGKSLSGIASPTIKQGRYSKYLPTRLNERYHESLGDSELLALREEIALLDSRLADLLGRVDSGEAGATWKEVKRAHEQLTIAMKTGDSKKLIQATMDMDTVIGKGLTDYMAWAEISSVIEQRRKLVADERKRLIEMEQIVTSEQATLLVMALLDSVMRNVKDRNALTAIQADFTRITTIQDNQRISIGAD